MAMRSPRFQGRTPLDSTNLRLYQREVEQYPIEFSTGSSVCVDRRDASIPRVYVHRQLSSTVWRTRSMMQRIDRNY
jgi:hypothetical protein